MELSQGRWVNGLHFVMHYGYSKLWNRIDELRSAGWHIEDDKDQRDWSKQERHYLSYKLSDQDSAIFKGCLSGELKFSKPAKQLTLVDKVLNFFHL